MFGCFKLNLVTDLTGQFRKCAEDFDSRDMENIPFSCHVERAVTRYASAFSHQGHDIAKRRVKNFAVRSIQPCKGSGRKG